MPAAASGSAAPVACVPSYGGEADAVAVRVDGEQVRASGYCGQVLTPMPLIQING